MKKRKLTNRAWAKRSNENNFQKRSWGINSFRMANKPRNPKNVEKDQTFWAWV